MEISGIGIGGGMSLGGAMGAAPVASAMAPGAAGVGSVGGSAGVGSSSMVAGTGGTAVQNLAKAMEGMNAGEILMALMIAMASQDKKSHGVEGGAAMGFLAGLMMGGGACGGNAGAMDFNSAAAVGGIGLQVNLQA